MISPLYQTFILHTRPYLEGSLLIEILSHEVGRKTLIARGARRQGQKSAKLQLFTPLWLSFGGRGALPYLHNAEEIGIRYNLKEKALLTGLYLNELIYRGLPREEASCLVFDIYKKTLESLCSEQQNLQHLHATARRFECSFLSALGYGIDFEKDRQGDPISEECYYRFELNKGFLKEASHHNTYSGKDLLDLHKEKPMEMPALIRMKQLIRPLIREHIGILFSSQMF